MGVLSCFGGPRRAAQKVGVEQLAIVPVDAKEPVSGSPPKSILREPKTPAGLTGSSFRAPRPPTVAARLLDDPVGAVRDGVIGQDHELHTAFGPVPVTYADYTASGRCLNFVEDFIREHVMPTYANTHTEASATGLQTTRFVEEARATVMECVNASAEDVLIFTGTGSTGAIGKLIGCLEIRLPHGMDDKFGLSAHIPAEQRPVIFVGPMEHHSNEVMWRETVATVVPIEEDEYGFPSLEQIRQELETYKDRPLILGAFSAGSNVTGLLPPQEAITNLLHEHGGNIAWDFAGCGPYVKIDMNPKGCAKGLDAVFISPHKFIGGPGTPGVLVAKRHLLTNRVPNQPGGGTVVFVDKQNQWYHGDAPGATPTTLDIAHREEGGTPGIIQIIRCGLAFAVKRAVGEDRIEELESALAAKAITSWEKDERIMMVGHDRKGYTLEHRMTILSINIKFQQILLSPHFVISLLNDVYGIQARSGCSCTGPYGHRLLNVSDEQSERMRGIVFDGQESVKIGWARVNLNYFISDDEANFIITAVHQIAEHGWKLLPFYRCEVKNGAFTHRSFNRESSLASLHDAFKVKEESGTPASCSQPITPPSSLQLPTLDDIDGDRWTRQLAVAQSLYAGAEDACKEMLSAAAGGLTKNMLDFERADSFSEEHVAFRAANPLFCVALASDAVREFGLAL